MTDELWCEMRTPVGTLTLVASPEGLSAILWPIRHGSAFRPPPGALESSDSPPLSEARSQLEEYFEGRRTIFDLPLAPQGTEFQLRAWIALRDIPFGEVRTYAQQAVTVGRPTAVRAIGAANARNPLPIVVPCHRVIGAGGALTGFAGGIEVKRWLLAHERAHCDPALGATPPLWRDA